MENHQKMSLPNRKVATKYYLMMKMCELRHWFHNTIILIQRHLKTKITSYSTFFTTENCDDLYSLEYNR